MKARRIASNAELMRLHSASAGDLRTLTIPQFAMRWSLFAEHYQRDLKLRIDLAKIGARI